MSRAPARSQRRGGAIPRTRPSASWTRSARVPGRPHVGSAHGRPTPTSRRCIAHASGLLIAATARHQPSPGCVDPRPRPCPCPLRVRVTAVAEKPHARFCVLTLAVGTFAVRPAILIRAATSSRLAQSVRRWSGEGNVRSGGRNPPTLSGKVSPFGRWNWWWFGTRIEGDFGHGTVMNWGRTWPAGAQSAVSSWRTGDRSPWGPIGLGESWISWLGNRTPSPPIHDSTAGECDRVVRGVGAT